MRTDEQIVEEILDSLSELQQRINYLCQLVRQIDTDRHAMVYCEELD